MYNLRFSVWRALVSRFMKYRMNCKCVHCESSYFNLLTRNSSVFSIKIAESGKQHFKTNRGYAVFAGFLTWLGLKKEEEDHMISVIKLGVLNLQRKEYNKAETVLHLALKLAQERQDLQAQRYVFDLLANIAFEKGDIEKAEKLFIELTKELLASGTSYDDNSIVEISLKLASIYSQRSEREKAESGFKFCISTQLKKVDAIDLHDIDALSEQDKDTVLLWAMSMDWYAKHLLSVGMLADAKENFQKAFYVSEKLNGPSHPQTLVLMNDIGSVQSLLKEYSSAIETFETVIKRSVGSESTDVPAFYCNLGATYLQIGDVQRGENACKMALRLAKKTEHSDAQTDAEECLAEVNFRKST